jgi:hypothetical protein
MALASAKCTDLAPTIIWQLEDLDSHIGQRTICHRALALLCRAKLTVANGPNVMCVERGNVE